ncbi:hypothetical protein BOTBODRAFT_246539 [Botryobasidium botryosum FD-172 SS1]|uniref:Uncharacterized protein n=1 Tax=Botryobasidium botryosum (strain FD-172 SS1) TaxID=930990 RepID=A0A067M3T0_BOTB1|nr:hypothetical protein BOTBODRAFT_246539 [Botryobasidium botryosum FD-172 SS1]
MLGIPEAQYCANPWAQSSAAVIQGSGLSRSSQELLIPMTSWEIRTYVLTEILQRYAKSITRVITALQILGVFSKSRPVCCSLKPKTEILRRTGTVHIPPNTGIMCRDPLRRKVRDSEL